MPFFRIESNMVIINVAKSATENRYLIRELKFDNTNIRIDVSKFDNKEFSKRVVFLIIRNGTVLYKYKKSSKSPHLSEDTASIKMKKMDIESIRKVNAQMKQAISKSDEVLE